jgi:hypothetical protein
VDVCELVERWMPRIELVYSFETWWEEYFGQILPHRHARGTQSAVFIVHCRLLPVNDVSLMVARHVWHSRRDPVWDFSS